MKPYQFHVDQVIPSPVEDVFSFFEAPANLERLTPPWLRFSILTPSPITMREGVVLDYQIRLHGLPMHWKTLITLYEPPFRFVDEQLSGPYAVWRHEHRFEAVEEGTRIVDDVHYMLPWGWAGSLAHRLFVRRDVQRIFDYRQKTLVDIFQSTLPHRDVVSA